MSGLNDYISVKENGIKVKKTKRLLLELAFPSFVNCPQKCGSGSQKVCVCVKHQKEFRWF